VAHTFLPPEVEPWISCAGIHPRNKDTKLRTETKAKPLVDWGTRKNKWADLHHLQTVFVRVDALAEKFSIVTCPWMPTY
jgi:hypothetical protein